MSGINDATCGNYPTLEWHLEFYGGVTYGIIKFVINVGEIEKDYVQQLLPVFRVFG